jgi:hypothetical protein
MRLAAPKYSTQRKAGINAKPKKPAEMPMAATGALIRAAHFVPDVNAAESSNTWSTRDNTSQTPACA